MRIIIPLLFFFILVVSGCISTVSTRPDWVHDVTWTGNGEADATIEALLWNQIEPDTSIEYATLDITATHKGDVMYLNVRGTSNQTPYMDIYNFIYENGNLTMTGYMLEAIHPQRRMKALSIAMQDMTIRQAVADTHQEPTVKRILPETSEKFYEPKTLYSVTWQDLRVSALVDIPTNRVVDTWMGE